MNYLPAPSSLNSADRWADLFELQRSEEPHVHQIELTNHCPYSCIMCPRATKMTRPLGFMETDLYQKVIDEIAAYSETVRTKEIELFHFGESLLHPRIHEMVGYASAKKLKTVLSVNAPLLTPPAAAVILGNEPHRLIISLDGYDEESYRRIRGPAADFSKAVQNIKSLIEVGKQSKIKTEICVRIIRLELNSHFIDRFVREWEHSGIGVEVRPFFPWTEREMIPLGEVTKYPPGMPCPFPWQYLVVQWDGTIVPCCRDYNGANRLGNASTSSLKEVWNSEPYEAFRKQHRSGEFGSNAFCRGCTEIFYTEPGMKAIDGRDKSPRNLRHLWQESVRRFSSRPLMISDEHESVFTYEDAGEIVTILAEKLQSEGVRKDDRICVCSPLHPEALLTFWAAALLGIVFVPLDTALSPKILRAIIQEVEPAMIFCDGIHSAHFQKATDRLIVFDSAEEKDPAAGTPFSDWIGKSGASFPAPIVGEDDSAAIIYTSGTTGIPKGIVLSQGTLYRSGKLMALLYGWREGDTLLSLGDLHTMSGLRNPALAAIHAGCTIIIPPNSMRANALAVAETVRRHEITLMSTVPAMIRQFNALNGRIGMGALKSLRMVLSTGSTLTVPAKARFREIYGVPVYDYYGLTETAGLCIGVLPGAAEIGQDSIGVPLECLASIVDEHGIPLGFNTVGELAISSSRLMSGYYRKPELTEKVLRNGWFYTGDYALQRPDGSIVLEGRKDDSFKDRRGELVQPFEIEQALEEHSAVAEVGVCRFRTFEGEDRSAAFVVLKEQREDTENLVLELRRHLLDRLGSHKVPSLFSFVRSLPKGTNGKLVRRKLAERVDSAEQDDKRNVQSCTIFPQ